MISIANIMEMMHGHKVLCTVKIWRFARLTVHARAFCDRANVLAHCIVSVDMTRSIVARRPGGRWRILLLLLCLLSFKAEMSCIRNLLVSSCDFMLFLQYFCFLTMDSLVMHQPPLISQFTSFIKKHQYDIDIRNNPLNNASRPTHGPSS